MLLELSFQLMYITIYNFWVICDYDLNIFVIYFCCCCCLMGLMYMYLCCQQSSMEATHGPTRYHI